MSAPRLVRAMPLWWHLHMPCNEFSLLVTRFLLDTRSSGQEPSPDDRCILRAWDVVGLNEHVLNEGMRGWAGALIPELHLVLSCFCPHCPDTGPQPMSQGLE